MSEVVPIVLTAYCPLCEHHILLFRTVDDARPRYVAHNCRAGRECDNSGELVNPKDQQS